MALTYEPIAQTILQSNTASVSFGNLSGYTDLRIVCQARSNYVGNADAIGIRFNNDTATNYSAEWFAYYNGAVYADYSVSTNGIGMVRLNVNAAGDPRWGVAEIDIMSYANTTTHKVVLGSSFTDQELLKVTKCVGVWRSTSAITAITLYLGNGTAFYAGSTFCVYGILAA